MIGILLFYWGGLFSRRVQSQYRDPYQPIRISWNVFISLRPCAGFSWAVRLYRHQHHISPNTSSATSTSSRYALTAIPFYSPSARRRNSIASSMARSTTKSSGSNSSNSGNSSNNSTILQPHRQKQKLHCQQHGQRHHQKQQQQQQQQPTAATTATTAPTANSSNKTNNKPTPNSPQPNS